MPARPHTHLLVTALLVSAGCRNDSANKPTAAPPPPAEVGVITLAPTTAVMTKELPARTSAFRVAEVRARVTGVIQKRLFTEGADVKAGQLLYQIDAAPYRAALDAAHAQLQRAKANAGAARLTATRSEELKTSGAISTQEYEDAMARRAVAEADIAAANAAVRAARINLDYTSVRAPIDGRIGRSELTEGGFVQQTTATLLATIQQLDPLYVDMSWSAAEVQRVRGALASGTLERAAGKAQVTILLEDGSIYPVPGELQFADLTVEASTGTVALRALVANPTTALLPGMFVRARVDEGQKTGALLVPQRAVSRDPNGRPLAMVVGADGKVERRVITADRVVDGQWLVTAGVVAGEQVVVEGLQKARPGATVRPVPMQAAPAPVVAPTPVPEAGK